MEEKYTYDAVVNRVVDGDTLDLTIDLGFSVFIKQRVRLLRVNTPEIYGVKKDSEEYKRGKEASQITLDWVANNGYKIRVYTKKTEKYGRYLAEIYSIDSVTNLNEHLISNGYQI